MIKGKITALQLSLLLKKTRAEAEKIMFVCWQRTTGNDQVSFKESEESIAKSTVLPIEDVNKYLGIDLNIYIKDIRDNYLTRPATYGYVMQFPEKKLAHLEELAEAKKDTSVKNIALPDVVNTFLTKKDIKAIRDEWEKRYGERARAIGVKLG